MTLRRWLLVGMVLAATAQAGCRHGCGDRRLCGNGQSYSPAPGRLLSNPGPVGYADSGYAMGPVMGTPVAAPGGFSGPPNELPFPGGDVIAPPGVPLAQGKPPELPLPHGAPVGLPK